MSILYDYYIYLMLLFTLIIYCVVNVVLRRFRQACERVNYFALIVAKWQLESQTSANVLSSPLFSYPLLLSPLLYFSFSPLLSYPLLSSLSLHTKQISEINLGV